MIILYDAGKNNRRFRSILRRLRRLMTLGVVLTCRKGLAAFMPVAEMYRCGTDSALPFGAFYFSPCAHPPEGTRCIFACGRNVRLRRLAALKALRNLLLLPLRTSAGRDSLHFCLRQKCKVAPPGTAAPDSPPDCRNLSFESLPNKSQNAAYSFCCMPHFGTPEGTRTPDLLVRSQTLYPTELPAHVHYRAQIS